MFRVLSNQHYTRTAPIRSYVRGRTLSFSKSWVLRASISFFPLTLPRHLLFFCSCPNFLVDEHVQKRLLRRLFTAWIFESLKCWSMYQRIILLHINDSTQVIFAARFIWRQHSNMTTLLFHRKTCDLFFLKITWFCVPWWFCYQGLIRRNAIPSCVINMKILFHYMWNLILF